jgi:hypothetical protein
LLHQTQIPLALFFVSYSKIISLQYLCHYQTLCTRAWDVILFSCSSDPEVIKVLYGMTDDNIQDETRTYNIGSDHTVS